MREDWFRGQDWDSKTQRQFEDKLSRARVHRAQYLRIKGYELTQASKHEVREAGRQLLRRVLAEHPDEELWVLSAHHDLGSSLAREGAFAEATEHYAQSLAFQRERGPGMDPGTRLALAELIVEAQWAERYQEASDLLSEFLDGRPACLFPSEQFRVLLAEARMAERLGQEDVAKRDAEHALALLADNRSPFPRHPGVGTIQTDKATFRELERLAAL